MSTRTYVVLFLLICAVLLNALLIGVFLGRDEDGCGGRIIALVLIAGCIFAAIGVLIR